MSTENTSTVDFFHTNKIIYKISGVWWPGKHVPITPKILYLLYLFLFYTTAITFVICELLIFGDTFKEVKKFVSHIGLLFTHIVGILKFFILVFRQDRLQKMMNALQDENYRYDPLGDFQPDLLVLEGKQLSAAFSVLVFVLYTFVGVSAHISSVIIINRDIDGNRFEGNMTCYDFMPYYFYIPFSTETKTQCSYAFFYMDIALCIFAWQIACHDGVFVGLLNCLRVQFLIVGGAFRTIRQRCLKQLNMPEDFFILHEENKPELEIKLYKELCRCTEHLNLLLRTRDDIESSFTYVNLAQTLASLFIIASCLFVASSNASAVKIAFSECYQSSTKDNLDFWAHTYSEYLGVVLSNGGKCIENDGRQVPVASPEFFAQVEYFICILTQLSLMCWFGNEITSAGKLTTLSMYEGDWFSASSRFKQSMILTMCRMQRPVYLSIGKFSPLALATLVAVCRGSFSYFAVFKSIQ